jgi:preprotein translocase subunit SecF
MEFFKTVTKFPFMGQRKVWYGLSSVLVVGSIVLTFMHGLNLGIDFTGGVVVEYNYSRSADLEATRQSLHQAGFPDVAVQSFGTDRDVLVRLPPVPEGQKAQAITDRVTAAVKAVDGGAQLRRNEVVGAQVGQELVSKGLQALAITLVLIMLYVWMRFEWKFGVGAVLAALHDPILVLGVFAVTGMTFDLSVLAAILAVIGYSLNDTVVVFDRVRERFLSMRKATPREIMDVAINETLSRTVITSGTTLLTVIALFVLGGETLRGFAAALIVGIVVGTYSSIFVAAGLALDLGLTQEDLLPSEKKQAVDDLP